jgi:hypothetical protein
MKTLVALLRAVNVGGTGKLPMVELRALAEAEGLLDVRTYIQSGNLLFSTANDPMTVKDALEKSLKLSLGKPVGVIVRTAQEGRLIGRRVTAGHRACVPIAELQRTHRGIAARLEPRVPIAESQRTHRRIAARLEPRVPIAAGRSRLPLTAHRQQPSEPLTNFFGDLGCDGRNMDKKCLSVVLTGSKGVPVDGIAHVIAGIA